MQIYKLYFPILIIILIIPVFIFLLKPNIYWNMHDDMQMIRQLEFEKCLSDGQIPCRWAPDVAYGYGLPLFNYYPPLPYIVGQIFRTLGASFIMTVKYTAILQFVLSALFMYLLSKTFFGKVGGLISALFYSYAPYHALNIYVRGAMNEAWASVFFPLIFLFSKKLIESEKTKYIFLLAISYSLLLLCHLPMALIFTPILILWSLFWLISYKKFHLLIKLAQSALLSIGLSSFFVIPAIFETALVQISKMFTDYYAYYNHFASIFQLFISNFWHDGGSIWGTNDGMSFSVGYLHWILPLIIVFFIFYKLINKKRVESIDVVVLLTIITALLTIFMVHERSTFIWKIFPTIQKIQFPWRFLNLSIFLLSFAVGYSIKIISNLKIKKNQKYTLFAVIIFTLISLNYQFFTPITSGPLTDSQKFAGQAWLNQVSGAINDYLPLTASTAPISLSNQGIDLLEPPVSYTVNNLKQGSDWLFLNLNLDKQANITLPVLAFPEFKLFDYFKPIKYQIDPLYGRIMVTLPAGEHQLYLKLFNTPIRTISNYISLISWLLVFWYILKKLWTRKLIFNK